MRRLRRRETAATGAPAWMVTYADLMSLLLAFFVLLVSFSEIQKEKLGQALSSLRKMPAGASTAIPVNEGTEEVPPSSKTIEGAARRLQERLLVTGHDRDARLEYDGQGGLRIILVDRVLFDEGSAALRADGATQRVLTEVAAMLAGLPEAKFEVRGHSDDRRPLAGFQDGYDLSAARAMAVARHLAANGVTLERAEVVACGDGRPIATNATPEGRAANRRVEIHVRGGLTPRQQRETAEKARGQ